MNQDENKNRVEDTNEEKNKEIAKKDDKVDEKNSKNFQLTFDRNAALHKVFWIAKTVVDITHEI